MPSALEKLVKILKLEQDTGFKNTAVIGGLQSYAHNWMLEAHQQARTSEHHALVEELAKVIDYYGSLDDKESRFNTIRYMLGRITGRTDALPQFKVEWTPEADAALSEKLPPAPPPSTPPAKPQRERSERAERPPTEKRPPAPKPAPTKRPPRQDDDEDEGDDEVGGNIIEDNFELVDALDLDDGSTPRHVPEINREPLPKPRPSNREALSPAEIEARWAKLREPVAKLKGVGERRQSQLALLGIATIGDLLFHLPRRYDDYTRVKPLAKILPMEQVAAVGTIKDVAELVTREHRRYLRVTLEDMTGTLPVVFFGQPHLKRYFRREMQIAVFGKVELFLGKPQMTNPEWEEVEPKGVYQGAIMPVYGLTKGITNKIMRGLVEKVVAEYAPTLPDYMPLSVLERAEMVDLGWAIQQLHFPEHQDYIGYAQERLAFDELMLLQLGILSKRFEWQAEAGIPLHVTDDWLNGFVETLPFPLTNAQVKAVEAIRHDMGLGVPMNRLLQGDVGSGKTVVAAMTVGMAIANGQQAAIMAPTSILAEQHYKHLSELFAQLPDGENIQIRLLTGATPEAARREIYEGLADGSVHLVIGTHALIQERVNFKALAVAVIDEQHRFGVDERGGLRGKGTNPHILVMTATPIPRTLALTMYADLDLTVLDEMPAGRTPIQTRVLSPGEREKAYEFIRDELKLGRQAYIIYPLVDDSDSIEARSAIQSHEKLSQSDFYKFRVGLLHGRLKPSEKDEIMGAFARHELDVLVATTVIEVGINVPNATVIMIEGANRFGLAQLHQLRGRVGRGAHTSYCMLLADNATDDALDRLHALEKTTNGFELAELDWQLRGAGDLLGTRQAGAGVITMARQMNMPLVELAQMESRSIYEEDPTLSLPEHQQLAMRIANLRRRDTDFS